MSWIIWSRFVCLYLSGHRTMLLLVSALLLLLLRAVPTAAENPAVRVTLTDKGLQYGKAWG